MAITFVGSKTFIHNATTEQSCSLTDLLDAAGASATLLQHDIIVVNYVISTDNVNRTNAQMTPTGYTAFTATDLYRDDDNNANQLVSYKFMGVTPDATVSIPASNATTAGVAVVIHAFRGVDTTTPSDVTPTTAGGVNSGLANAAAITPVTAGSWILACGAAGVAAGAVFTNPAGMSATTNHFRSVTITTTTSDANAGTALLTTWTSGNYNPAIFGGSTSTNTGTWVTTTIALRPARNYSSGTASTVGVLKGSGRLVGTSAGVASLTGTVRGSGTLAGSVAGVASASGLLENSVQISASSAGVATVSGTLTGSSAPINLNLNNLMMGTSF
jgi:hypothetical protein